VLSWDGTAYAGWQRQPGPPTVQSLLLRETRRLCGPDVRVVGASRTDAGVHALRQTVSVQTTSGLAPEVLLRALNASLPRDIRVIGACEAGTGFDARRCARGKRYAYLIDNGPVATPLLERYAWHIRRPLDIATMRDGLAALRGRHDFSAFRAAAGREAPPVCTVRALHVFPRKQRVIILVSADRYLHHMVRTIVGSAVDIGQGRRPAAWLGDVLRARDRTLAGMTAPARGLFLVRVVN
jgi:tRNA pseudouridine38-40 synthase